ncbi:MAG: ABC transporter permease, partial [Chloroflexi bacterium]|nr:ABC transporter permease [Chloroflexota bacterium]
MSASLRKFLITRLLLTIPMVLILITVVFFVMRVLPGDPIRSQLGPKVSAEQAHEIRERLGLNRPILEQYVDFIWKTVRLDLGNALTSGGRPIRDELAERLPATIELTVPAMLFTAVFGVLSGAYAAKHRGSVQDYGIRAGSILVYAVPVFFMGLMFQIIFSVRLAWLPLSGRMDTMMLTQFQPRTGFYIVDAITTGNWPVLRSAISH